MAKEYAKSFYNSKAWQKCRAAYIAERITIDGGMCEKCHEQPGEELHHIKYITLNNITDSNITLNPDNLMWLCKDCHFKEHREAMFKQYLKKKRILVDGMWFDDEGMPHEQKVKIVYGSPASGKSTYVRKHKDEYDMVVDVGEILETIGMCDKSNTSNNLLNIATGVREYLYTQIENKNVDCKTVWVIASLPNKKERTELAERLGAELIFIPASYETCIKQAEQDTKRRNKELQRIIIEKWFENYQE